MGAGINSVIPLGFLRRHKVVDNGAGAQGSYLQYSMLCCTEYGPDSRGKSKRLAEIAD
jgi:hypothetical protein